MSKPAAVSVAFTPALFNRDTAAVYLARSVREIDELRQRGEITPYGEGKRVYFKREDLDRIVEQLPERATEGVFGR